MLVPDGTGEAGEPRFRAVVMDFGLAKERRAGAEVAKLTATGIVLGTPEFMSPEQIRGKPLDGRSDVYALGILAFELFTGQLPFAGKSAQETMIARLRGSPAKLRDVRPELLAQAGGRNPALPRDRRRRAVPVDGGAGARIRERGRHGGVRQTVPQVASASAQRPLGAAEGLFHACQSVLVRRGAPVGCVLSRLPAGCSLGGAPGPFIPCRWGQPSYGGGGNSRAVRVHHPGDG